MKTKRQDQVVLATVFAVVVIALLSACSVSPKKIELQRVKSNFAEAQQNQLIRNNKEASAALATAGETLTSANREYANTFIFSDDPPRDPKNVDHLTYLADQQIASARTLAERDAAEQRVATLTRDRDNTLRLALKEYDALVDAELAMLRQHGAEIQREGARINVVFSDVTFELNKSDIKSTFKQDLGRLAFVLNHRYPAAELIVEGHTDITGPDRFNEILSEDRAGSVKTFLIDRGLDPNRVSSRGLGSSSPIASNETPEGRAKNRRVELIITGEPSL